MITDPGPRDPITDSQSDTKPDANDSQTAIAQFSEKMEVVAAKGNAQCCQLLRALKAQRYDYGALNGLRGWYAQKRE